VVAHLVSVLAPDSGYESVKVLLLSWRQLEVVDRAALQTHEVMVVSGQPLGELVTSKSVAVVHCEDSNLTHNGQRTIKRRQWHGPAKASVQFSRGLGAGCDLKRAHNRLTPAREPDSAVGHPTTDGFGSFPFLH
jgi:hypothetical protein